MNWSMRSMTSATVLIERRKVRKQQKQANKLPEKYRLKYYDRPVMLAWAVFVAHIATWIVSALYYLVTQVKYTYRGHTIFYLKTTWDRLPSHFGFHAYPWWEWVRHDIRNVYIGLLASLFVLVVTTNPLKWKPSPPGFWTKTLHIPTRDQPWRVTPLQLVFSPVTVSLAGLFGFTLGVGLLVGLPALARHGIHIHGHSFVAQEGNLWASQGQWQTKAIGVLATFFFARWVFMKVAADIQLFFLENKIKKGKTPQWWWLIVYPPTYRLRYQYMIDRDTVVEEHGKWIKFLVPAGVVVSVGLAACGYWLLNFGPASHVG